MGVSHDKITQRLAKIIHLLNSGECLSLDYLVDEFKVSLRTAQRDMHDRLTFLPIKKENGCYSLEDYCLGELSFKDIKFFSTLSGIKGLYPSLSDEFIVDLLNEKVNKTYLVKGFKYEDMSLKSKLFESLNIAIVKNQIIKLTYKKKNRELKPYKIINTDGIWYLSADENNKLKTYTLAKISNLEVSKKKFTPNKEFVELIEKNQDTWFSKNEINVVLEIDEKVKEYFIRRELLPHQCILKNTKNLIISTKVSYEEEILKVVRQWIPHIKIIEPIALNNKLMKGLKDYIDA